MFHSRQDSEKSQGMTKANTNINSATNENQEQKHNLFQYIPCSPILTKLHGLCVSIWLFNQTVMELHGLFFLPLVEQQSFNSLSNDHYPRTRLNRTNYLSFLLLRSIRSWDLRNISISVVFKKTEN